MRIICPATDTCAAIPLRFCSTRFLANKKKTKQSPRGATTCRSLRASPTGGLATATATSDDTIHTHSHAHNIIFHLSRLSGCAHRWAALCPRVPRALMWKWNSIWREMNSFIHVLCAAVSRILPPHLPPLSPDAALQIVNEQNRVLRWRLRRLRAAAAKPAENVFICSVRHRTRNRYGW